MTNNRLSTSVVNLNKGIACDEPAASITRHCGRVSSGMAVPGFRLCCLPSWPCPSCAPASPPPFLSSAPLSALLSLPSSSL